MGPLQDASNVIENEVNVVNLLHVAYEFCTFMEGTFYC